MLDKPAGSIVNVSVVQFVPGAGFLITFGGFIVVEDDERLEYDSKRWMMSVDKLDWRTPPFSFANVIQYQALVGETLMMVWNAFQRHTQHPHEMPDIEVQIDLPESIQADLEDIDFNLEERDDPASS